MTGYSLDDLIGQKAGYLSQGPLTDQETIGRFRERLKKGVNIREEIMNYHKDGHTYWIDLEITPIFDQQGRVDKFISIEKDITERKSAQERMRKQAELLNAILATIPYGVVWKDKYMRCLGCNQRFADDIGLSHPSDIIGKSSQEVRQWTQEETEFQMQDYYEVIRTSSPILNTTKPMTLPNGKSLIVSYNILPLKDDMGEIIGVVTIYIDITEREEANRELAKARDMALAGAKAKSEFLANMSHEIRTPMNGVIGMTELLLSSNLNKEQQDFADTIKNSAEALLSVINDVLDFSKIEVGRMQIEQSKFDLRILMEEICDLLSPSAFQKNLEFTCMIPSDFPHRLKGDPARLRQILNNLAGNAIKFTEHGEVNLSAILLSSDDKHASIRLECSDTGIGIPPDRQEAIFESFTQADGSTNRKFGGTGLGLTISRQLTELMGGAIGLESEPGRGSRFWVDLTLEKQERTVSEIYQSSSLQGIRALIVDDNATNRSILKKHLLAWGCVVVETGSGKEAVESVRESDNAFQIVLMDMCMPEMNGLETAQAIQELPQGKNLKMLLLTSGRYSGDSEEAEKKGILLTLSKPVRLSTLYAALLQAFNKRSEVKLTKTPVQTDKICLSIYVLLAEDNPVNQKLALHLLKGWGCRVDLAENGRETVRAVQTRNYDMVLMDIQMPEMDGLEAAATIREWEKESGSHLPIIAMTAHAMEGDREACLSSGMDDYLSKPIRSEEFLIKLKYWSAPPEQRLKGIGMDAIKEPIKFDAVSLLENCGGDKIFMREMINLFLEDGINQYSSLQETIKAGDSEAIKRAAHKLKRSCKTVEAADASTLCSDIEKHSKDILEAANYLEILCPEYSQLCDALRDYLESAEKMEQAA